MTILIDKFGKINPDLILLSKITGFTINEDISLGELNQFLNRYWNQKCQFRYRI